MGYNVNARQWLMFSPKEIMSLREATEKLPDYRRKQFWETMEKIAARLENAQNHCREEISDAENVETIDACAKILRILDPGA